MPDSNLWILTEERPKHSVIQYIIEKFARDRKLKFCLDKQIIFKPIMKSDKFQFQYNVEGITIDTIKEFIIKIVSGNSSFVDFLIFFQNDEPESKDIPIYAIEETKTSSKESRNTAINQRMTKFVFLNFYSEIFSDAHIMMLYNIRIPAKTIPGTFKLGMRMLNTANVDVKGIPYPMSQFPKFSTIEELIIAKNSIKHKPGNVFVKITKQPNVIEISGKLKKPGGWSDPNIGYLSMIAFLLRKLGWQKDIMIINHGLQQSNISRNKFLLIANKLNIKLDGLSIPKLSINPIYWYYDKTHEKIGTIFLHLAAEMSNCKGIYENHGGSEQGYFETPSGEYLSIGKKDGKADLVLLDEKCKKIMIIEGEQAKNAKDGIEQLKTFKKLEESFIKKYYPKYMVSSHVVLFGDELAPNDPNIALQLKNDGTIIESENTPSTIKNIIKNLKFI